MKRIIVILALLFAVTNTGAAEDLHTFSVRGSLASFWNEGWGDKFFFKAFGQEDLENGSLNFNRTLRHSLYANPEIWYNIRLSNRFALSLCARYEHMKISLEDNIAFSWVIHYKSLSANLNFCGIGGRLQWMAFVRPYIGINMGYCYGDLTTNHVYEVPDQFLTRVNVKGDGGGLFYDIAMGTNIPMTYGTSLFLEGDIRFTSGWKRFENDEVYVEGMDHRVTSLLTEDRRLDRFIGWILRVGIQIGI